MESVILCGMPFSGKSTIGKKVAELLSLPFIDTDTLFEKPPRVLFQEIGETGFRKREKEILYSLKSGVIALGGGSFYFLDVIDHLKSLGEIYYLKTSFETLFLRIKEVPAYLDKEDLKGSFEGLYLKRVPVFEKYATKQVNTEGKGIEEIAREVVFGK
jgi:shikimate kinase